MTKNIPNSNNIKELCDKKGITSLMLAKKIGTSAPHMSRLINGQSPLSMKWLLKISATLKVPTGKIAGISTKTKYADKLDDTLLGSIMGWLLEASDDLKIKLSREDLGKLTSFLYKQAVAKAMNFDEVREAATLAIQIKKLLG